MKKSTVEKHFDKIADTYDIGKNKYSFYYSNLKKLLKKLIPENKTVLEIGCGTGDLLASLKPKNGIGTDISREMVSAAMYKYKNNTSLIFLNQNYPEIKLRPDYIFMSDVIEHLEDPQKMFNKISKIMNENTVFINTMANPLWEPILLLWEKLGLKMVEGPHERIGYKDISKLCSNAGMKILTHDYKLLIPIKIPYITDFTNKYLEKYLKRFAFIEYFSAVKV